MRFYVYLALAVGLLAFTGCSKFKRYYGPEVTRIVVMKSERRMYLMNDETVLKSYDVDLGFAPDGHKQQKGDGRTPEGRYFIDRRNPDSLFHLSLGISYPNDDDREYAESIGEPPGGDIFIHGARRPFDPRGADWTAGCISVSNREIERIYSMVHEGTVIDIFP
ncbi:MAG: L,D-transpeptidase family protein [Rhodobacteraceae bacterium]|nr:L,D-transpeptidase family protein [Paracoccaceae bacterium]